ncbi:aminopeptidase P family protein [Trichothermofontia sp.]
MVILHYAPPDLATTLRQRRQRLATHFPDPVVLWSGQAPARNFPANRYPFRASSHFLYFAGLPLERAAIRLEDGCLSLYWDEPSPAEALWHGPVPSRAALATQIGADAAFPLSALRATDAATIALTDATTRAEQAAALDRPLVPAPAATGRDRDLAHAIVRLRLCHDAAALSELRKASDVSVQAQRAGMRATATATTEAEVRAAIEQVMTAHRMLPAYRSIVTVHGEVLHNEHSPHALQVGDLLLADAGAETAMGWAADITRTWPVSGKFSPTQREVYEVVLAAHDACIAAIRPGVEFRALHELACRTIAAGLVALGILRGQPDSLVAQDIHARFFPHGLGHLLGLDVHDMEDLGDLAGYALGRQRSDRFGLSFLRLDRPLQAGMVVTIEPGFYQIPALLHDRQWGEQFSGVINWARLAQFKDVRGIRIEDDVWVTETGSEVLTAALPTHAAAIEQQVQVGP